MREQGTASSANEPPDAATLDAARRQMALAGPVRRAVFVLALPVLGEQLLNSTVAIVDVYLAGQISVVATSAIGLAAYVAWLISMLFMLVGTGTTALVSRFAGASDRVAANRYSNQSLGLAIGMGLASCLLIVTMAPTFARLQNMTGETSDIVVRYLRIDAAGHIFTALTLVGSAALRGVSDMRTPLKILTVVNLVNIVVSFGLVFGAGPIEPLGLDGIVIGTVVGRVIGGVLTIIVFAKGRSGLRLRLPELRPHLQAARRILRIGLPAAVDGAVMWSGHFVFLMVIANLAEGDLGQAYYAAHIVGIRIEALTYLPAVVWAMATATVVGQSLGAGDPQRAVRAGHEAVRQCGLLGLGLIAFYYFGADLIFTILHTDDLVREVGPPAMRLAAFFQVCLTTSIIYVGALRGAGDTRFPLIITIICVLCVRLPLGYFFGIVCQMGLVGAWIGMCSDNTVRAILATIRYTRGRWVETRV